MLFVRKFLKSFQCVGNRDFDWSEICCCHENFITCHECNIVILLFVKLKGSAMILLSKLPVDGTRNGNDATQSACKPKQLWPSDCPPILKRTLCCFMASSLQPDDAPTTLYLASTTWMETPMHFELPSNRTLEFSGSRTVAVKSCGAEKRSFTVVLAVAADGAKVPPKVIFKGVRTPRDLVVPHPLRVSFHKKGWMDEQGIREWIRQSLPRAERSLLVWDSFRAHLTDSVKDDLKQRNIDVAVIPGGLTPVVQPLDKCLNKPFKDNVRRKYLAWMTSGPFEFTPAGKKKAPSRNLVLRWIKEAWAEIPEEMVVKSFKTCGISNALDGTEDDVVYSEETPEVDDEDIEENEFDTDSENETDGE